MKHYAAVKLLLHISLTYTVLHVLPIVCQQTDEDGRQKRSGYILTDKKVCNLNWTIPHDRQMNNFLSANIMGRQYGAI